MSFSFVSKTLTSFAQAAKTILADYFLLKEDGFYLLLENGGKIILEESTGYQFSGKNTS